MTIGIVEGNESVPADAPWSVTSNGSYFNEGGTPVNHTCAMAILLRPSAREPTPFSGAGMASVQSSNSSDFVPQGPYDLAVQAAPRLMDRENPRVACGGDAVDGSAGLALSSDGAVSRPRVRPDPGRDLRGAGRASLGRINLAQRGAWAHAWKQASVLHLLLKADLSLIPAAAGLRRYR